MNYRSKYMNAETSANKIRRLTKIELEAIVSQCKSLIDITSAIGIPRQKYYKDLFLAQCEKYGVDASVLTPNLKKIDLTGRVFGHLEVLKRGATLKCGNTTWICREKETGIEKPVLSKHLLKGTTKSFSFGAKKGSSHHQWTGFGMISGNYWNTVERHAATRKLDFEITIQEAWDIYIQQDRKCALSGVEIYFGESNTCPYTASFDRIDSSKGYVKGNVQWVHTRVNIMKNKFSEDEFIWFCHKIVQKNSACPVR